MSLLKLKGLIGQGAKASRKMYDSTNKWAKNKIAYTKSISNQASKQTLNYVTLHERNGSRGNGIGMGHRNNINRIK
jgi:hypothetical protein